MAEKRKFNIEYYRILSQKLQSVPAWRDLADACQSVLGQSVDERRRRLEKIRDSVKYRRGDTLVDTIYKPENGKIARVKETGIIANLPDKLLIPTARVRNVIKNIAYYGHPDTTDYVELEFTYKNQVYLWLKAVQLPQDRDALLKNAYIMGFDFFNTKLSDEDLQRLYDFIQIYWNESGTSDNYVKFIGFIKNARFDLINLWSYDDGKDIFPELEPKGPNTVPAYEGGKHYLTNHVELRYDISQFNEFYSLNLDDLETLFYYFAPIIVVLERIVGSLNVESDVAILSVNDLTLDNYSIVENDTSSTSTLYQSQAAIVSIDNYSLSVEPTSFTNRKTILVPSDIVLQNYEPFDTANPDLDEFKVSHKFKTTTNTTTYNLAAIDTLNTNFYYSEKNTISIKSCLVNFLCIHNFSMLDSQL